MRLAARRAALAAALAWSALAASGSAAGQPDPAVWDAILSDRVKGGGFDYRGATGQDRKRLAAYLANLGDARPAEMLPAETTAFYINAYNAMAVAIVLEHYPVKSIRDIPGAFSSIRKRIGGEMLTLDDLENRLRQRRDPRVHFAIVCASRSCPPLLPRAYRTGQLGTDLESQGRVFVRDSSKNVIDSARGRVDLSRIFEWNRKEFEGAAAGHLNIFVARFAPAPAADWLRTWAGTPKFLPYDWSLNQP